MLKDTFSSDSANFKFKFQVPFWDSKEDILQPRIGSTGKDLKLLIAIDPLEVTFDSLTQCFADHEQYIFSRDDNQQALLSAFDKFRSAKKVKKLLKIYSKTSGIPMIECKLSLDLSGSQLYCDVCIWYVTMKKVSD